MQRQKENNSNEITNATRKGKLNQMHFPFSNYLPKMIQKKIDDRRKIVCIAGWPKAWLRRNARHSNGCQFARSSRFAVEYAWIGSDGVPTAMESIIRIRFACRF